MDANIKKESQLYKGDMGYDRSRYFQIKKTITNKDIFVSEVFKTLNPIIRDIIQYISKELNVHDDEQNSRKIEYIKCRSLSMWLLVELFCNKRNQTAVFYGTDLMLSTEIIGAIWAKDHATVMHHHKTIQKFNSVYVKEKELNEKIKKEAILMVQLYISQRNQNKYDTREEILKSLPDVSIAKRTLPRPLEALKAAREKEILYKEEKDVKISVRIKQNDGIIEFDFTSDCGKFGTDENLAGYKLTPEGLLKILNSVDNY